MQPYKKRDLPLRFPSPRTSLVSRLRPCRPWLQKASTLSCRHTDGGQPVSPRGLSSHLYPSTLCGDSHSPTVSMGKSKVSSGASEAVGSPSRLTILTQPVWAQGGGDASLPLQSGGPTRSPGFSHPSTTRHSRSKQTRTVSLSTWITCWAEPGSPSAGGEGI